MKRQVSQRLGSGTTDAAAIRGHVFFKHVNWDDVLKRGLEPPIKPILRSDDDVSQFDIKFTKQIPVDSPDETTLSESANKIFQGFTYVAPSVLEEMHESQLNYSRIMSARSPRRQFSRASNRAEQIRLGYLRYNIETPTNRVTPIPRPSPQDETMEGVGRPIVYKKKLQNTHSTKIE